MECVYRDLGRVASGGWEGEEEGGGQLHYVMGLK